MNERKNELERELRVITAWIRDVTAKKQERLREIRRELLGLTAGSGQKTKVLVET
jgi:hypothetical protein